MRRYIAIILFTATIASAQTFNGRVIDQNLRTGLSGATIFICGTETKTVSGPDGSFSLPLDSGMTLDISRSNYVTRRYPVLDTLDEWIELSQDPSTPVSNEAIYAMVGEAASFPGGFPAFFQYVQDNFERPRGKEARKSFGKVFVQFVVERDGHTSEVSVLKGICPACDNEMIRLVKASPPWKPGTLRGERVRHRLVLPLDYPRKKQRGPKAAPFGTPTSPIKG